MKLPKGTFLADFTRFEPSIVQIRSRVFALGVCTKKKDTTKSRREVIFHLRGEFPAQPNLTKIDVSVGVADVNNHTKFGNDRSKEYKVTEGRILPWSIGLACRL